MPEQYPVPVRELHLLRHAKSSWDDPRRPDDERPLTKRGRRAAKAMGRLLRDQRIDPRLILCSPAVRARETLERIEPMLRGRTVRVEPALYGADVGTLLKVIGTVPDGVGSLLVIGHNPGLQDLALHLARRSPVVDDLAMKFPTAALATLAVADQGWPALQPHGADLVRFVRPRDLER
jgi:phosphohistidine phosphatase